MQRQRILGKTIMALLLILLFVMPAFSGCMG